MSKSLVLDASVAAKWYIKEEDSEKAQDLLLDILGNKVSVWSPVVFWYEVGHILNMAERRERIGNGDAVQAFRNLRMIPIGVIESSENEDIEALSLAIQHRKSFYDMSYLVAAMGKGWEFCTADMKIVEGVSEDFPEAVVVSLSSL